MFTRELSVGVRIAAVIATEQREEMSFRKRIGSRRGPRRLQLLVVASLALAAIAASAAVASADNSGQLGVWGQKGTNPGKFALPALFAAEPSGAVYVADRPATNIFESIRIQKFSSSGTLEGEVTIPRAAETEKFVAMAVDPTAHRLYLLRDQEEADPETGKALTLPIEMVSTVPSGGHLELIEEAGAPKTLPVPTGTQSIDNPTDLVFDPSSSDLVIAGENQAEQFFLQRVHTAGSGSLGASYTETTNSAGLNSTTVAVGGVSATSAIAVGPTGTTYIYYAKSSSHQSFAFTLPASLVGPPAAISGFTANVGEFQGAIAIKRSREGSQDGFGPQIAISTDGETLYFKDAATINTGQVAGNTVVVGYQLSDGGASAVYGGNTTEGECAIQTSGAALAAVTGGLDVLDQGAESTWGSHVILFGSGGSECPAPSAAAELKVAGGPVTTVHAGTSVTLDSAPAELGDFGASIESITWKIKPPSGPVQEHTVPSSDPNPRTFTEVFATEGTYSVSMSMKVALKVSAPVGVPKTYDSKPKTLVVTAAAVLPTVTGLNPTHGAAAGGNLVTITGTNLTGATAVKFGSASATEVTVVNATTVTAKAPACTPGASVHVTVTTPEGTSATGASDEYKCDTPPPLPTVTGLNPTHGAAGGGNLVTITGTNLTGATAVKFGTAPATEVTVVNATTVTAKAPAGLPNSTVDVTVTTPEGTSVTGASDKYGYDATTQVLTVAKAGSGSGTVTSTPAGIDCGAACTATFASGTAVSLVATPAAGSTFAGWGGACSGTGPCVVGLTAATTVTATFNPIPSGGGPPPTEIKPPAPGKTKAQILAEKRQAALKKCKKLSGKAKTACVKKANQIGKPKPKKKKKS
jgi:hypothetical protein